MNDIDNIILALELIRLKLSDPAIVFRSVLIHVPEATIDLFTGPEQATMVSYGWEIHSAEGGYMYRFNQIAP